jgi:hypothetical protein
MSPLAVVMPWTFNVLTVVNSTLPETVEAALNDCNGVRQVR